MGATHEQVSVLCVELCRLVNPETTEQAKFLLPSFSLSSPSSTKWKMNKSQVSFFFIPILSKMSFLKFLKVY